ncbi:hypothetical protein [Thermostaphylospora chromogena]|uniref:Uncharacterized protein n=1 Tax=Thermostaphylospora chromogena TaxID=35622 RepID=A0A1H1DWE9_9ACTN|nr:hypothetical protein [Thermostaphylospora chromogena]SDQ80693.1 hypothetical protein SAMN04489764_2195 [Thermostaphylospora chromogena]
MAGGPVADVHPEHAQLQADRIYLGWQHVLLHPDPGPPPKRPSPPEEPEAETSVEQWAQAERLSQDLQNRPVKIFRTFMVLLAVLLVGMGLSRTMSWSFVLIGLVAALGVALICTYAIYQGDRAVRHRLAEERARRERARAQRARELFLAQEEHARRYREWQEKKERYDRQVSWYAVAVPDDIDRIDVAGGTLPGWSALITLIGATRLYSGGHLTVLDLSEGAIAKDLIELAARGGDDPLVWVLPGDLPKLDLGATLSAEAFADVLAHVVSVSEDHHTTRDLSFDNAILERVLEVLGENATINQVTAALRALAQVGDPRDDLRNGLITATQLERIGTLFGRGVSDRVVIERAWALESQLRKLEALGSEAVRLPPARLRVVSMDRQAGVFGNRVLGTYVTTALTHILRQAPASDRPWYHTIIVAGADKLRGDVLDRLMDACETSRTGLVLTYRSLTPTVRERLGRGHAAVAFMRLGNAEDARVASEHVGAGHRLELARLTETISATVGGGDASYTSTVGDAEDGGQGRGSGAAGLKEGITVSTEWGRAASKTTAESERALHRSREFLVEPHELQQLPTTSVIVTDATAHGRRVRLADANPAILTFPKTTLSELEDVTAASARLPEQWPEPATEAAVKSVSAVDAPPNLGPPPPRLDWRRPR